MFRPWCPALPASPILQQQPSARSHGAHPRRANSRGRVPRTYRTAPSQAACRLSPGYRQWQFSLRGRHILPRQLGASATEAPWARLAPFPAGNSLRSDHHAHHWSLPVWAAVHILPTFPSVRRLHMVSHAIPCQARPCGNCLATNRISATGSGGHTASMRSRGNLFKQSHQLAPVNRGLTGAAWERHIAYDPREREKAA